MSSSFNDLVGMKTEEYLPSIYGFAIFQVAATCARLGIPDLLVEGPKTADELAAVTESDRDALYRLLRAASAAGFCTMSADGRFGVAALGRMFARDSPWQAGLVATLNSAKPIWQAWGSLESAIRSGKAAFDHVHGCGLFNYLERDPQLAALFHATMAAGTESQLGAIVQRYDFTKFAHVVDIGGGNGTQLAAILAAGKSLRGTVFDTTEGLRYAPEVLSDAGVADRGDAVSGDFFAAVPAGADAYLLKNVLTDWDDESCVRILTNCRKAMAPHGKIVVLASLMPTELNGANSGETLAVSIFDLSLLVLTSGRERALAEYESLFTAAGLRLGSVTPIAEHNLCYAIEAIDANHGPA